MKTFTLSQIKAAYAQAMTEELSRTAVALRSAVTLTLEQVYGDMVQELESLPETDNPR